MTNKTDQQEAELSLFTKETLVKMMNLSGHRRFDLMHNATQLVAAIISSSVATATYNTPVDRDEMLNAMLDMLRETCSAAMKGEGATVVAVPAGNQTIN